VPTLGRRTGQSCGPGVWTGQLLRHAADVTAVDAYRRGSMACYCGYCFTVSTTLARKDATAPLASGVALPLHWPLSWPEVYLGRKAPK
jgi:hypothetical protein